MPQNPDRLVVAKEIFADTLDLPREGRRRFVEAKCGSDQELLGLVRALIDAHEEAGRFMGSPLIASELAAESRIAHERAERLGSMIGPYKLLEQIGEGGFGVVYMAEQTQPVVRRVAIKIIKLGMDTKQVIARFEAERQALAMMDHPNIAKVLDAGTTEAGRPYFVMELVRGDPITEYCDRNQLTTDERLALFTDVCHAVQHAHQKGIIHRDIKPSNVLVTIVDGQPIPKVIDFGIAKAMSQRLTDKTLFTGHRQLLGTPQYMSPEQAEMSGADIDTRSDLYSLGVLLYELLTGTTPFDPEHLRSAALGEIQRIIREEEPEKPSTRVSEAIRASRSRSPSAMSPGANQIASPPQPDTASIAARRRTDPAQLVRAIRGDLDWIVMKCLEKNRARRYETADALALDVERHLSRLPVQAAPPSRTYRIRRFIMRNRRGVIAAGLIAAALVIGLVGTVTFAVRESAARNLAESHRERADTELARAVEIKRMLTEMLTSASPFMSMGADTTLLNRILDDASARLDRHEVADPVVEAELRAVVGRSYLQIGAYGTAERHMATALEARVRLLGSEHPDSLDSMLYMAELRAQQSRYAESETLAAGALQILQRTSDNRDVTTLRAMQQLAEIYVYQGRYAEAEALARQVVETATITFGEDHQLTQLAMGSLARACRNRGNYDEAEALLRRLLELTRRTLGESHPNALDDEFQLAVLFKRMDRLDEAEELSRKTLATATRVLGEMHPLTLRVSALLANICEFQGRESECEVLTLKTLANQEQVLGAESPEVMQTLYNLANLYARQHRYEEAEPRYRRVLENQLRTIGTSNPATVGTMYALGKLYVDCGRLADAEQILAEAVDIQRRQPGNRNPGMIPSLNGLANVIQSQRRYAEAEPLRAEIFEIMRECLGEEHPETLLAMNKLAWLRWRLERFAAAEELLLRAIDIGNKQSGRGASTALSSMSWLAQVYNGMGRYDQAVAVCAKCLPAVRNRRPAGDPEVTRTIATAAEAYLGLGLRDEAVPLYREALGRQLSEANAPQASAEIVNEAAWMLLTHPIPELRDPASALALAERACARSLGDAAPLRAACFASLSLAKWTVGNSEGAGESYRQARSAQPTPDDPTLIRRLAECAEKLHE